MGRSVEYSPSSSKYTRDHPTGCQEGVLFLFRIVTHEHDFLVSFTRIKEEIKYLKKCYTLELHKGLSDHKFPPFFLPFPPHGPLSIILNYSVLKGSTVLPL